MCSGQKLAAHTCTGKNVFIGFSVHNEVYSGEGGMLNAQNFLFRRAIHIFIGLGTILWMEKKFFGRSVRAGGRGSKVP